MQKYKDTKNALKNEKMPAKKAKKCKNATKVNDAKMHKMQKI
jgi:hypothetical protein